MGSEDKRLVPPEMTIPAASCVPYRRRHKNSAAPALTSSEYVLGLSYELVKYTNIRKTIAKRLVEAKRTTPHFCISLDCELDALLALRSHQCRGAG